MMKPSRISRSLGRRAWQRLYLGDDPVALRVFHPSPPHHHRLCRYSEPDVVSAASSRSTATNFSAKDELPLRRRSVEVRKPRNSVPTYICYSHMKIYVGIPLSKGCRQMGVGMGECRRLLGEVTTLAVQLVPRYKWVSCPN